MLRIVLPLWKLKVATALFLSNHFTYKYNANTKEHQVTGTELLKNAHDS